MRSALPPVPAKFEERKTAILSGLAQPKASYHDASPKGSVDQAIIPLIHQLNSLPGVVTTSSCAGRISVFLEGLGENGGGKGSGGRWLFVSHEPVDELLGPGHSITHQSKNLFKDLGLHRAAKHDDDQNSPGRTKLRPAITARLVRLQFEPMILHIMTASLHHARPLLAAAINAGFRESGIQSLKNLDNESAFPMLAVRSTGLAFETALGLVENDHKDCPTVESDGEPAFHSFIAEHDLELVLDIANNRFPANEERKQRFEKEIALHMLQT